MNNILPGYIKTKMTKKKLNNKFFLLRKSRTLLDRWGKTEDVAGLAVYLISDGSKYTTGTIILMAVVNQKNINWKKNLYFLLN